MSDIGREDGNCFSAVLIDTDDYPGLRVPILREEFEGAKASLVIRRILSLLKPRLLRSCQDPVDAGYGGRRAYPLLPPFDEVHR